MTAGSARSQRPADVQGGVDRKQGVPASRGRRWEPEDSGAEGVAVDNRGNVYGAEVGNRALKKYVKK